MSNNKVAIIGAGLAGISAARYLKSQGFIPTVLESHNDVGGQWNRHNANSGVWSDMRTNTSRFTTKLSDVQYPEDVSVFPRNGEVLDMIKNMISLNNLGDHIKTCCRVSSLSKDENDGYDIVWEQNGTSNKAHFDKVVVATGRYNKPTIPEIEGLESFSGELGYKHTFYYKGTNEYLGKTVVACGGSISGLEIACDLAMVETKQVLVSQRMQRWMVEKMINGIPYEYMAFTRELGMSIRTMPKSKLLALFVDFMKQFGGDPVTYGAPAAPQILTKAKLTVNNNFLQLVAEDRIQAHPWIERVDGRKITFADGSNAYADAILFGTGFELNLPFLSDEIANVLNITNKGLDLAEFTFHPDLPNLAFMGLWEQLGPYSVPLEQQARWIAYSWGGAVEAPTEAWLRDKLKECQEQDYHSDYRYQNELAPLFAALAGCDPANFDDPVLQKILPKSAVTGEMFRIVGTDSDPKARDRLIQDFKTFAPLNVKKDLGMDD